MAFDPGQLGGRIKAIRKERGLPLAQVSKRSGVAVSTLSKIENGQTSGSVDTIFKIARGLGVLFDNLFEVDCGTQAGARRIITRGDEASQLSTEIYDYLVHAADLTHKQMLPLVMKLKARSVPAREDWSEHEGEEFVYVLDGAVELHTEFYAATRLEVGDSAYFDSKMRHAFVAASRKQPTLLSICLSDRPMPRAGAKEPDDVAVESFAGVSEGTPAATQVKR